MYSVSSSSDATAQRAPRRKIAANAENHAIGMNKKG
jgi:hypothetical protein